MLRLQVAANEQQPHPVAGKIEHCLQGEIRRAARKTFCGENMGH
jgi:hypothetical protein